MLKQSRHDSKAPSDRSEAAEAAAARICPVLQLGCSQWHTAGKQQLVCAIVYLLPATLAAEFAIAERVYYKRASDLATPSKQKTALAAILVSATSEHSIQCRHFGQLK